MTRVTQQMVAKKAGVDRSTVSYALSGKPLGKRISPAVLERVLRVARDLQYVPNRQAQSLVTGRAQTMALMVQTVTGSHIWMWNEAAAGAEEELFSRGYNVLVSRVKPDQSIVEQAERLFREGSVDGVVGVLWGSRQKERNQARRLDFPVAFATIGGDATSSHVYHDVTKGCREAVEHAYELGHRNLAWVTPTLPKNDSSLNRIRTIRTQARRLGMTVRSVTVTVPGLYLGPQYHERLPDILNDLRRHLPDPREASAVLCWNDLLAHAVCAVLRERGLRIPEDVSVIGFDDIEPSVHVPPLTTVSGAYREMGAAAARLALDGDDPARRNDRTVVVPTYLVVRQSTGEEKSLTETSRTEKIREELTTKHSKVTKEEKNRTEIFGTEK